MEILYCESCGKRIRDGDPFRESDGGKVCEHCQPAPAPVSTATMPVASAQPETHPASGTIERVRTSRQTATVARIRETGKRAHVGSRRMHATPPAGSDPRKPEPKAPTGQTAGVAMAVGGVLLLVVGIAILTMGGGKKPAQTAKNDPTSSSNTRAAATPDPLPVSRARAADTARTAPADLSAKPANAAATATSKPTPTKVTLPDIKNEAADESARKTDSMDDLRERFAKREWDKLRKEITEGSTHPYKLKQKLEKFVASHGSTRSGQAAKDKLATMDDVQPPPPPPPADVAVAQAAQSGSLTVALEIKQADDDDTKFYKNGTKDTAEKYKDLAWSWRGAQFSNGWFSSKAGLDFGGQAPTVREDSWLRIAVKTDCGHLCFHSGATGGLYETWVRGVKTNQWTWVTVKMSDYKRALQGNGTRPAVGSKYTGTVILTGRDGKPSTIHLGPVIFGHGPLPD